MAPIALNPNRLETAFIHMSTRLLLALDEHWPDPAVCRWVLLGADDRPLAEGHSDPRHWPAAATCEVLLCGPQVLWLEVALPPTRRQNRRDLPRLLAYALEDRLLADPDTQHLTPTHRQPAPDDEGTLAGVLVIARERLRTLLNQLDALGRRPRRIVAEVQSAPASAQDWHLSLSAAGAILRCGPRHGIALDVDTLPELLLHALSHARAANQEPERLRLHLEAGLAAPDLDLGLQPTPDSPYRWWQGISAGADNLLHDEFAAPAAAGAGLGRLRAPLQLACAALAIGFIAHLGEVLWLRHQHDELKARIARIHQTTFPGTPAVAPLAQMRRALAQERSAHGLLRHDDALTLLAQAADALGTEASGSVRALHFEDGMLDLTLSPAALQRQQALLDVLNARGLLATLRQDGASTHLLLRAEILQ